MIQIQRKKVMLQQINAMSRMNSSNVYEQKYSSKTIVPAFEYFARSRSLYIQIRKDYQLPSIATLTKLTSKFSNTDDNTFITKIFENLNNGQKNCILLIDEVYVKPMLTYHGGHVFGSAANDNSKLAKTVLSVMVVCLYGGPKFVAKMVPVYKLDADFLFNQSNILINQIQNAGGNLLAIICDSNHVNQAYLKEFECIYFPLENHRQYISSL